MITGKKDNQKIISSVRLLVSSIQSQDKTFVQSTFEMMFELEEIVATIKKNEMQTELICQYISQNKCKNETAKKLMITMFQSKFYPHLAKVLDSFINIGANKKLIQVIRSNIAIDKKYNKYINDKLYTIKLPSISDEIIQINDIEINLAKNEIIKAKMSQLI